MIDTGIWRNVGERLWAVRHQVQDEEMFLANYSDGLAEVDLDWMVAEFKASGKIACFLAVPPSVTFHLADIGDDNRVRKMTPAATSDLWINGGFFIFRREIFDYMNEGEELVVEPFQRLIAQRQLVTYRNPGFWACMDTFKEKKMFDDMYARGDMPWMVWDELDVCHRGRARSQMEMANGDRVTLDRSALVPIYNYGD